MSQLNKYYNTAGQTVGLLKRSFASNIYTNIYLNFIFFFFLEIKRWGYVLN